MDKRVWKNSHCQGEWQYADALQTRYNLNGFSTCIASALLYEVPLFGQAGDGNAKGLKYAPLWWQGSVESSR